MIKLKYFLLIMVITCIAGCRNTSTKTYAIKDFRESIQPFLFKIASIGIVTHHDSSSINSITNEELIKLTKAENSVLRATALGEMLHRSSFNSFDIIMKHLDDTATVATDNGEFGIKLETVSDYLLGIARWNTFKARASTIESVLTKHNYLSSAYYILTNIEAQEKYYPYIKAMATRPRRLDPDEGYELGFSELEYALYGLAKFQKKEDVSIIKEVMIKKTWELSDISFRIMTEFPDTAYLDVLQDYHKRQFYKFSGNRPHGFTGVNADRASPEDFIEALIIQKNDRSAKLLDTMLVLLAKYPCIPDKENITNTIINLIWENPCPAYTHLREKIKYKAKELVKKGVSYTKRTISNPPDTTLQTYHWFN